VKTTNLLALTLAVGLFSANSSLTAEEAAPQPRRHLSASPGDSKVASLPENYLLTLTVKDKETVVADISLVAATPEFNTSVIPLGPMALMDKVPTQATLAFSGRLTLDDDGSLLVQYALNSQMAIPNTVQETSSPAPGTVVEIKSVILPRPHNKLLRPLGH